MGSLRARTSEPRQERSRATRRRLLDAAIDELADVGYAGFTTSGVARRAGVSRGAQQGHFPHRHLLLAEALAHLTARQVEELERLLEDGRGGPRPVAETLDLIYRQYCGPLFLASMELALARRTDVAVAPLVAENEREVAGALDDVGRRLLAPGAWGDSPERMRRWALALSTIRGLAVLRLLGHTDRSVDRRWREVRADLAGMLERGG